MGRGTELDLSDRLRLEQWGIRAEERKAQMVPRPALRLLPRGSRNLLDQSEV